MPVNLSGSVDLLGLLVVLIVPLWDDLAVAMLLLDVTNVLKLLEDDWARECDR